MTDKAEAQPTTTEQDVAAVFATTGEYTHEEIARILTAPIGTQHEAPPVYEGEEYAVAVHEAPSYAAAFRLFADLEQADDAVLLNVGAMPQRQGGDTVYATGVVRLAREAVVGICQNWALTTRGTGDAAVSTMIFEREGGTITHRCASIGPRYGFFYNGFPGTDYGDPASPPTDDASDA